MRAWSNCSGLKKPRTRKEVTDMHDYYPLLLVGGILGLISVVLIVAFAMIKDKKQAIGFDRHMKDG